MPHPPVTLAATNLALLLSLAVAFAAALVGGVIAARLRQSPILGYLVAGLVIGPFTPGFVADAETTQLFADIGIILLLFGVGVHFSLKDLVRLKVVAGGGGVAQVALTIAVGMLLGVALGWSPLAAFFLGSAAAISSSAVLAKVLEERGEEGSEHGTISLAWMVVQDLATIMLVVLLEGLSNGEGDVVTNVATATVTAAVFVGVLLVVGVRVLPWLLDRVAALQSRELFLVAVVGLSFGTAFLAEEVGISLALGAFLAGLVLSESDLAHHVLGEIGPARDLFAVLFFVSVGMLVDPRVIAAQLPVFGLLVLLIVGVKAALGVTTLLVLRYPPRTALLVGAGIAQAGEFSFLLAQIGREANVLSQERFTLILGACAASIVVAPLLFLVAERLAGRFESRWTHRPFQDSAVVASPLYRGHVIVCGHGRVGGTVTRLLRQWGVRVVVVDEDRDTVHRIRAGGDPVIFGNAANPYVLDAAGVRGASGVVVALPEALDARRVLTEVRQRNPDVDILLRAHSDAEQEFLMEHGATEVVVAEEELALEMVHHTLHIHGAKEDDIHRMLFAARHRRTTHDHAGFDNAGAETTASPARGD